MQAHRQATLRPGRWVAWSSVVLLVLWATFSRHQQQRLGQAIQAAASKDVLCGPSPAQGSRSSSSSKGVNITIALTTVPQSAAYIRLVLSSLLDQTVPPDRILLGLQQSVDAGTLELWQGLHSKVQVVRFREDHGPAMKYIPAVQALRNDPAALVIVVDDDKVYPPTLVEDLLAAHSRQPAAAVGCRGWRAPPSCTYTAQSLCGAGAAGCAMELTISEYGHRLGPGENRTVDVLTGSDAYAFRPAVFAGNDSLWTFPSKELREAARMDDVWISGHLAQRGVPRLVAHCQRECADVNPRLLPHGRIQAPGGWSQRHEMNTALLQHFCPYWLAHEGGGAGGGGVSNGGDSMTGGGSAGGFVGPPGGAPPGGVGSAPSRPAG
ncbi:hypothetical protein N2152v2_002589 [Parachlorella kessleri]